VSWEEYIETRLHEGARPHAWIVVLGYELLRVLERDRLIALLKTRLPPAST
jgi:hypothetical protein